MCGICGIVGTEAGKSESEYAVRQMMKVMTHRGPDGEGIALEKDFIFGHKRLAIIDLELGAQPMISEDGNIVVTYNGEIYNYLELRQSLVQKGLRFKTFSDTEVLIKMYEAYGIDCLKYLNGMFAFAIYDKKEKQLFAARDHFGIKPFYYTVLKDGSFLFASEIKAILQHPAVSATIDQRSLNQYFTFQFCLGERTLFKDIKKLEPANYLRYYVSKGKKSFVKMRYWQPSYEIDTHHTEKYFIDQLKFLLQDSIKNQLRSDVPLGAYLSGGIDSSSVVAFARGFNGNEFHCFTGKFMEGKDYDESSYAKMVAAEYGCVFNEIVPSAKDFIDLLPNLIYQMDEPAAGPGLFPQYMVSKLAKENVTVVLGGQGGDELFGGYARYLIAYLEQCIKGSIFETQEEGRHVVTLESIIKNLPLLKKYVPLIKTFWESGLFDEMDRRYFRLVDRSPDLNKILSSDMWDQYDHKQVFEEFQKIFNDTETISYFNKMTAFDQKTLLPALLQVEDRVSMAVSLESRVPLLDYRIAELLARMPPMMKFSGGRLKFALKMAVNSLIPKPVLERKDKMGFPVPLKEWWDGPLKEFVEDILFSKTSRERGIFDIKYLRKKVLEEDKYGRQIWGALNLELWNRNFIDN